MKPASEDVRTGQAPGKLTREEFSRRYREQFFDPAFSKETDAIARLEAIAWDAYQEGRKAPKKVKAGPGYKDPDYELAQEWVDAKEAIRLAKRDQEDPSQRGRILLINASSRNDGTCPSEISKSYRMSLIAKETIEKEEDMDVDVLDLSMLGSEYGKQIHPCKGCLSTAMPLCAFPCSCYPNHSLNQIHDVMNDVYARWARAHGILIITPVYWYQAPSGLKLLIDRMVCADGGNPDPTSTSGKDPVKAKKIELDGWDYPQHLSKRAYGVVVHGDVAGTENLRRQLVDWLEWMGLYNPDARAKLDRYIGYYEPYATSHQTFDKDEAMQTEVRNTARSVAQVAKGIRSGAVKIPLKEMPRPRPK